MQVDPAGRHKKHGGTGLEEFRLCARIVRRIERTFGDSAIICRRDKSAEFGVGDCVLVHPETAHSDPVDWRFLWIRMLSTHSERAACQSKQYEKTFNDLPPLAESR
jgi:hypothetical protein